MNAVIKGIGSYVPEKILTNNDLAKMIDTSDEWIYSHTGIRSRHVVSEEQAASDLAYEASKKALKMAGMEASDLDLIIVSTASGDYSGFPSTACVLQEKLNAEPIPAFDLLAGCSGFVYGLEVGKSMILSGSAKNILMVGTEALSKITDWTDRDTCVLFGDGAGAAVLSGEEDQQGRGVLLSLIKAEGSGGKYLSRNAGGSRYPIKMGETPKSELCISMDGRRVYTFASRVCTSIIQEIMEQQGLSIDDIKYVVPHQANVRIIESASKRLGIPMDKFFVNIQDYANTSTASIPIALAEMQEKGMLHSGDLIITVAFGAGLTYGGNLIRW